MTKRSLAALLPVLALFAFVFGACKDDPPASPASQQQNLTGVAFDEQGYAIPFALVEAVTSTGAVVASDTTDEQGAFAMPNVSVLAKTRGDAAVALRISHSDFRTKTFAINTGGTTMSMDMVHVDSACGRLSMLIRDVTSLAVIPGAEVKLRRNGTLIMTTLSDALGRVEFNFLLAGQYSIRVAKTGYAVIERAVTIQFCDSTSLDLRMTATTGGNDTCCNGVLRIIPKDKTTLTNLVGAQVKLSRTGMDNRIQLSTIAGALFTDLCPGTYAVRIAREGYQVQEFSVTMGCNDQQEIDRLLEAAPVDSCCNGVITVLAKDSATGNPLPNATIKLWRGGAIVATKTADANGQAIFDKRCMGEYGLSVLKDGYKGRELSFQLGCDQTVTHTFFLPVKPIDSCCTAELKIRAIDSVAVTGGWIAGATVEIRVGSPTGPILYTGTTDIEGWYRKEGLCAPATYFVTVYKQGSYSAKTHDFNYTSCILKSETFRLMP